MAASLSEGSVRAAARELREAGLDGWLLYDLEARNRVAADLVGLDEGLTRRWFLLLRPEGRPRALVHRIELASWEGWGHELESYVGWEELETGLARLLAGTERVAMEVSSRDAVPILDAVPAGVVELVESMGVSVESSAPLIAGTLGRWGERGRALHRRAAGILRETARAAFGIACRAVGGRPEFGAEPGPGSEGARDPSAAAAGAVAASEGELAAWIRNELERRGLAQVDTIVAVGPNSAKPHYAPPLEGSAQFEAGRVFLVDLWGKVAGEPEAIVADQTWMGFLGPALPGEVAEAWEAVRAARDGAVALLRERWGGELPTGAEVDRHARSILSERGYADAIYHRTGHAIDRQTHGFGPNLDAVETRDERRLVPGIGFSVEPGLYFDGAFGLRTEINVHLGEEGPEVSPPRIQSTPWRMAG